MFYPATTVPKFKRGCYAMIGTTIATAVVTALIVYLQKREARSHTVGPDKFLDKMWYCDSHRWRSLGRELNLKVSVKKSV